MVEPIHKSTREEREKWIKEAHYNVFQLPAEHVYIDLITDSGTGAMSDRQWAGMMLGDESYAGATSFFKLKEMITRLTGFEYVIPTHQGRAAENVLFSYLVHEGDIVPGNSHFDTTKGHIEGRHATAWDVTIDEAKDTQLEIPFKGNVDPKKLEAVMAEHADKVPFIIVTITNNTAGGQPVSMQNLREVRAIADKYSDLIILTEENNRDSDPKTITDQIRPGISPDTPVRFLPKRADAIEEALREAKPGDCVALLGKGDEPYLYIGAGKVKWPGDNNVAREVLHRMGYVK